jgi:hypothetical protein
MKKAIYSLPERIINNTVSKSDKKINFWNCNKLRSTKKDEVLRKIILHPSSYAVEL